MNIAREASLILKPSSAAAECVFYPWNDSFNERQRQSLETIIFIMETSIMLSNVTFGYHLLFIGYPLSNAEH